MVQSQNLPSVLLMTISICTAAEGYVKPKIVGGQDAQPGQFPWQVSLQLNHEGKGKWFPICAGSIIDRKHVVSAAHCLDLDTDPKRYKVVAGAHDLNNTLEPSRQILDVCRLRTHPAYGAMPANFSDISLLTLSTPIQFNDRVKPIRLIPPETGDPPAGVVCTVSGWGVRSEYGYSLQNNKNVTTYNILKNVAEATSNILQYVNLTIIDRDICIDELVGYGYIFPTEFCAIDPEETRSPCFGDSGVPMVCYFAQGTHLTGIVSGGNKCGGNGSYGVYAQVSVLQDFIHCNHKNHQKQ